MARITLWALVLLLVAAGCEPAPTEPSAPATPDALLHRSARAVGGGFACPTSPDQVVTDEASLLSALAAAAEGDVVAIDGSIALTATVEIGTDGVTLTCATPGSGVRTDPPTSLGILLATAASGVAIEGLEIDASDDGWPFYTISNDGVRVSHNNVVCGVQGCGFVVGMENAVITDNHMESWGSFTGLHLQGGIDGARILRNSVEAHAPSWRPDFGGIRPRDGSDVLVKDNVVRGPWQNSVSSVDIRESEYSENALDGALQYGVAINIPGSPDPAAVADNTFRGNRISDAAWAGILARSACGNRLVNNRISGSTGIHLDVTSGDNHVTATFGSVIDDGAFDCDSDGQLDPNIVAGKAGHGGHVPAAQPALKTLDTPWGLQTLQ